METMTEEANETGDKFYSPFSARSEGQTRSVSHQLESAHTNREKDDFASGFNEKEIEDIRKAFNKYDKRKVGSIKPNEVADVFRMAGQNPTVAEASRMNQEADDAGVGMIMFSDMLAIMEKYWRSNDNYLDELKQACLAFDKKDMGIMDFEDLKTILTKYGEQLDEDDIELMMKSLHITEDGKVFVDEFIRILSPIEEPKKVKKSGKGKKGGSIKSASSTKK